MHDDDARDGVDRDGERDDNYKVEKKCSDDDQSINEITTAKALPTKIQAILREATTTMATTRTEPCFMGIHTMCPNVHHVLSN